MDNPYNQAQLSTTWRHHEPSQSAKVSCCASTPSESRWPAAWHLWLHWDETISNNFWSRMFHGSCVGNITNTGPAIRTCPVNISTHSLYLLFMGIQGIEHWGWSNKTMIPGNKSFPGQRCSMASKSKGEMPACRMASAIAWALRPTNRQQNAGTIDCDGTFNLLKFSNKAISGYG